MTAERRCPLCHEKFQGARCPRCSGEADQERLEHVAFRRFTQKEKQHGRVGGAAGVDRMPDPPADC